jgi:porin
VIPGLPHSPVVPKSGSWSATYTFHQYLVERKSGDGAKTGWGVFGTFTAADKTKNPVSSFLVVGLGGTGLFNKRQRDRFGISYSIAGVSRKLREVIKPVFGVRDEHTGEAFYNYSITPWMYLTADIQIIRPALADSHLKLVPGMRLVIEF